MEKHKSRFFIGLDLSATDKLKVSDCRDKLLRGIDARPVPIENFHITLSFLGHVSEQKMEQLHLGLDNIKGKAFSCESLGLGIFSKPQVLYLTIAQQPQLVDLAKQCQQLNQQLGLFHEHNHYRPHITLFRKYKSNSASELPWPQMQFSFDKFHLFESVSHQHKGHSPHYPIRKSFNLRPF